MAQLTRSVTLGRGGAGIRVNAVCPGDTKINMLTREYSDEHPSHVLSRLGDAIPLGRVPRPEELAYIIALLALDEASVMIGASVPVDRCNSGQ